MNRAITATDMAAALGSVKAQLVLKNARYLNVFSNEWLTGDIAIQDGLFIGAGSYSGETEVDCSGKTVVPGLIDGHIHLESSMLTPASFARTVVPHGTTTVVTDPHEITNVCGLAGFDYILNATKDLPLDVFVMVPSCVPASPFDESGCTLSHEDIAACLQKERVLGLAELMNYPGVIYGDGEVLAKVAASAGKLIDGHAPSLSGKELTAYTMAGVDSDHECTTAEEGMEKLRLGQWIMIRQGTASRNLDALLPLLQEPWCQRCCFATDDKHPDNLLAEGHIDAIVRRAIAGGTAPEIAYKTASYQAAQRFGLRQRGAIAPGYLADCVVLEDVDAVTIAQVYKSGVLVSDHGSQPMCDAAPVPEALKTTMHLSALTPEQLKLHRPTGQLIGLIPGQLLTTDEGQTTSVNPAENILKLCVIERHHDTGHRGICYVKGYGLTSGAVATSIAHDSHNIIAAGCDDESICTAVNRLRALEGGMVIANGTEVVGELPLPIAGLMCEGSAEDTAQALSALREQAYSMGVNREIDPFMTLSFVSLAVIPSRKLTTLGVVDVEQFRIVEPAETN